MGQFTYQGSETRVYPDITVDGSVLVAEAGKSYDLASDPLDGLWSSVSTPLKAPQTASDAPESAPTPED